MRRVIGLVGIAAAAAAVAIVAIAAPASAHNVLVASTPAAGSTLTALPDAFSVTTNEPMLDLGGEADSFALQVRDAAGLYYGDGCVTVVDGTMSATPFIGEAGAYTMIWQAVSADGHPVSGEVPFTWAPTDDVQASAGSATPVVCGSAPAPAETQTASPATPGSGPTESASTRGPQVTDDAVPVGDVLWIGGAVVAAGIAVAVGIVVAGRRAKAAAKE